MEQVSAAVLLSLYLQPSSKNGSSFPAKEHKQAARSQRQYTETQILELVAFTLYKTSHRT